MSEEDCVTCDVVFNQGMPRSAAVGAAISGQMESPQSAKFLRFGK